MDNNNLPKTERVIELLEELGELEAQKAVLLDGPYTPDYVASQAQGLTFQIAEIGGEIVQTVKDLEDALAALKAEAEEASKPRQIWSGWHL
jgi:hypothetical protein